MADNVDEISRLAQKVIKINQCMVLAAIGHEPEVERHSSFHLLTTEKLR